MTDDTPESNSILRQLLLSGDESDSPEVPQRKRKIKDNSEETDKRGRFVNDNSASDQTVGGMEEGGRLIADATVSVPSLSFNAFNEHRLQRHLELREHREFIRDTISASANHYIHQLMNTTTSNDSPQPNEDDLPVTSEMRRHFLQRFQERLLQDLIGLPI